MVFRGGLVDVNDVHLFPRDRDGFNPQNASSAQLRSTVLTCVSFVFGVFLYVEDVFMEHREAGHVRTSPDRVVGSSDIVVHMIADV